MTRTITNGITVAAVFSLLTGVAFADSFDDQINAAKAQQAQDQASANAAHAQANTAAAQLAQYNQQISVVTDQVNLSQAQLAKLNAQIADAEAKMASAKASLGASLKSMYLASTVTPLEMIASSSNLSEYFNAQQYQDTIKSKIQDAMTTIQQLKAQLDAQQKQVTQTLATQQAQQAQLAQLRQQQQALYAAAAQNAAAADASVQQKNSQIASLRSQQAAANRAALGGGKVGASSTCGGGYPWCGYAQDTVVDSWGMYNRECVSYTAFRVSESHNMPYWGGSDSAGHGGNAKQWVADAQDGWRGARVSVSSTPHVGDVAISTAGVYGHAMYVEGVSGGSIYVSQYNYNLDGNYSTMTTSASGLYFLTFH